MSKHGSDHSKQGTPSPSESFGLRPIPPTHHSEVEGLVAHTEKSLIKFIIDAVWEATDGGVQMKPDQFYHHEELNGEVDRMLTTLTTHSAKVRAEGFNEGMNAVRCQTAEEAYERGKTDMLRALCPDGLTYEQLLAIEALPQTDVTKN